MPSMGKLVEETWLSKEFLRIRNVNKNFQHWKAKRKKNTEKKQNNIQNCNSVTYMLWDYGEKKEMDAIFEAILTENSPN